VAAFEVLRSGIFWETQLEQTVGIHNNNLVSKGLKERLRRTKESVSGGPQPRFKLVFSITGYSQMWVQGEAET
jgi:hypothetical protein